MRVGGEETEGKLLPRLPPPLEDSPEFDLDRLRGGGIGIVGVEGRSGADTVFFPRLPLEFFRLLAFFET